MVAGMPVASPPSSQIVTLEPNACLPNSTQARPSSMARPEKAMNARYSRTSATAYSPSTTGYSPGPRSPGDAARAVRSAASSPTASGSIVRWSVLIAWAYPVSPAGASITVTSLACVARCDAARPVVLATVSR